MVTETAPVALSWHLVTGEYPPDCGGVSDYTQQLALALQSVGEQVHVWTSATTALRTDGSVVVHGLPGFGPSGLRRLTNGLAAIPGRRRLLVQYVPHAYGFRGMNLPFGFWLASRELEEIWVHFHEVAVPLGWASRPQRNVLAAAEWLMARLAADGAQRLFIAVPGWRHQLGSHGRRAEVLPIPSNMPVEVVAKDVESIRGRLGPGPLIGHFGTYSPALTRLLVPVLISVLSERRDAQFLLLGRGGPDFSARIAATYPALASRIFAPGRLGPTCIASHLAACEVLVQPFPDGISGRRTTAMAGLALGKAIVTTSGHLTEDEWAQSGAVVLASIGDGAEITRAVIRLLSSPSERDALGARARAWYQLSFSIEHTMQVLGIRRSSGKVGEWQSGR
jgi:glycosyltransferase involved in cell wall biosynthesis